MTPEQLRDTYGDTSARAAAKAINRFDKHCRQFIEHSPFLVLATSDGKNLDVSPKGDPAGFVTLENDRTLLIPDRPGNNRLDGLLNIAQMPKVAVIFFIPGVLETLRVNGTAEVSDDQSLCEKFAINGRAPKTVTRIVADEIYTHCGKAPMRAGLWKPKSWHRERPVASLNQMVRDHANMEVTSLDQADVENRYKETLY